MQGAFSFESGIEAGDALLDLAQPPTAIFAANDDMAAGVIRAACERGQVTAQADRMGYKLAGTAISCQQSQLLSEGICYGAVQIPPDGQPIVLLNDRQTLGGYPKIGSVLSLDCALLSQAGAGVEVYFTPISAEQAHNALCLAKVRTDAITSQLVTL